jgi:hypothetical protein
MSASVARPLALVSRSHEGGAVRFTVACEHGESMAVVRPAGLALEAVDVRPGLQARHADAVGCRCRVIELAGMS